MSKSNGIKKQFDSLPPTPELLRFSAENAKLESTYEALGGRVISLSLASGWSCPGAKDCLAKAVCGSDGRKKIVDGPDQEFRCFSASQEVQYPGVYLQRMQNLRLLLGCRNTVDSLYSLLGRSLNSERKRLLRKKDKLAAVRIHVAGDFFSEAYLNAWMLVAIDNPSVIFYAYTKSHHHLLAVRATEIPWPENLRIVLSAGSRFDSLIPTLKRHGHGVAHVVLSEEAAAAGGWKIDHDDLLAAQNQGEDFALLIHGTQPKGSSAADALKKLKANGVKHGYSKSKSKIDRTKHTAAAV